MKPFCRLRIAFTLNDAVYARFLIYAGWKLVGKEEFFKIGVAHHQPAIIEGKR